jgi:hypothetical protein
MQKPHNDFVSFAKNSSVLVENKIIALLSSEPARADIGLKNKRVSMAVLVFGLSLLERNENWKKLAHANGDRSILISLCLLSFLSGSVNQEYMSSKM